jgi:hypothetical protein
MDVPPGAQGAGGGYLTQKEPAGRAGFFMLAQDSF